MKYNENTVSRALRMVCEKMREPDYRPRICDADASRTAAILRLGKEEREMFGVFFLNHRHFLIDFEILFQGTLGQASVHPREVLKAALRHNAGAVIFTHNHPSGVLDPSRADIDLTNTLKSLLEQIDVRVLDHIIVAGGSTYSFAENGLV